MACVACAGGAEAQGTAGDSTRSHEEFVRQSLHEFAQDVVREMDSAQAHGFRAVSAHPDSANRWVEGALASLSGNLRAEAPVVRYRVSKWSLSLVKKTRRHVLGRFWVLRELHVEVDIEYPSGSTRTGIQRAEFDRTYQDWVPAADVTELDSGEFRGLVVPPASDFVSRWAAPVAVSAGLGLATYLFFSIR